MTTLETFQAYEASKAVVSKLQAELETELTNLEEFRAALRSELGIEVAPTETAPKKQRGGRGGKRGPRSLLAIASTAATRLLNEMKKDNKKKPAAVTAAMERVEALATKRGETVTEEIKAAINAKAEEIWKK